MGNSENQLRGGAVAGLVLITLGALIFLDNLGIIDVNIRGSFWTVIFLVWGIVGLKQARSIPSAVLPGTAVLAGVLLVLSEYHFIPHVRLWSLWPLALIAGGVLTLTSEGGWQRWSGRFAPGSTPTRLQETAFFSGVKRRVETRSFEGGELSSLFGGIEIDLRRSSLLAPATICANAVFGGIELRVPEEWRVVVNGFAAFGAYEDKTLPPRSEPGVEPPVLTITGSTIFGGVTISN